MTSWLKSLYMSPINYGLRQLNNVAINALSIFLNNYGNRLFRIDTEIIKETKCVENTDIFYLCPIHIENHTSQFIGLNLIIFESGIIDDISISFPWKTLLSDLTIVKIALIDLTLSIEKKISMTMTKSIYDIDTDAQDQNQDLVIAYMEINNIIQQYFKSVRIELDSIHIKIDELDIQIKNTIYCDKILSVEEIKINSVIIRDIKYDASQSVLHIAYLLFDPDIITYLPQIYLSDESNTTEIIIHIDKFETNDICVSDIKFKIMSGMITVLNLKELVITNVVKLCTGIINDFIFNYNQLNNSITFGSIMDIQLIDQNELINKFTYLGGLLNCLSNKIIILKSTVKQNIPLTIANSKFMLSYLNKIFNIRSDAIVCQKNQISILGLEICDTDLDLNVCINITNMICNYTDKLDLIKFHIHNLGAKTSGEKIQNTSFGMIADYILVEKSDQELEFVFSNTHVVELMPLINYIKCIVKLCKSQTKLDEQPLELKSTIVEDPSNSLELAIKIRINNSGFSIVYSEYKFDFEIKSGSIHITNGFGTKIDLGIFMNDHHIGEIFIDLIDSGNITISTCKIFLDPDIFDQLNYLIGTLIPDSSDDPEASHSQLIMTQSIMSKSVDELEYAINNIIANNNNSNLDTNQPVIKLLLNSVSDLHSIIINNYYVPDTNKYDLKLHIKSVNIYLFDELLKDNALTNSFLCVILLGIEFSKLSIINQKTYSTETKYMFKITDGYAIDMNSSDPIWKYFFKSTNNNYLLMVHIATHDDLYKLKINIGSLVVNIREETLLRLLGFFSNSYQMPKENTGSKSTAFVETFNISGVDIIVNFFPLILKDNMVGANTLFLTDFKIRLRQQSLENISGFDILISKITTSWNTDINPDNILQFVPNIKIIQPYTSGFAQIVKLVNKYFESAYNKKKLRAVTKNINRGINIVTYILRMGYDQAINLFS